MKVLRGAVIAADIAAVVNVSAASGQVEVTLPPGEALVSGDMAAVLEAANVLRADNLPQAGAAALVVPAGCERIRHMIAAPLRADGTSHGALVAASTGEREFAPLALAIAGLVAEQISLYHHLARTLDDRRAAERERRETALRQERTNQDLGTSCAPLY